jgi:hypothetical protein
MMRDPSKIFKILIPLTVPLLSYMKTNHDNRSSRFPPSPQIIEASLSQGVDRTQLKSHSLCWSGQLR